MRLSARNRIPATVTGVTQGEATANVELDAGGGGLVASNTAEAAREPGGGGGSRGVAVLKASDVILGVEGCARGRRARHGGGAARAGRPSAPVPFAPVAGQSSKAPRRREPVKAAHSAVPTGRYPSSGCLESRTAAPVASSATSTQF